MTTEIPALNKRILEQPGAGYWLPIGIIISPMEIALLDVLAVTGLCAIGNPDGQCIIWMLLSTGYKTSRW
jgi:hypothetical protein